MKRQPLLVNKNFDVLTTHDGFLHFRRKIWQLSVTLQTSAVDTFREAKVTESWLPRDLVRSTRVYVSRSTEHLTGN